MQEDNPNSELPWMTEEIKNQIRHRNKIVTDQNIQGLFELTDNTDFSIALYQILENRCKHSPDVLNHPQRTLFLCMHLENAGQADSILSFLQGEFAPYADEVVNALNEIGATISAGIIRQAVQLLPTDGSWFFENSDEHSQRLMHKLDSEFSSYPDGPLRDLYRQYAENHKNYFNN